MSMQHLSLFTGNAVGELSLLSTRLVATLKYLPTCSAEHHRPLTSIKLYCLVTNYAIMQLAKNDYMKVIGCELNLRPLDLEYNDLTITPPCNVSK